MGSRQEGIERARELIRAARHAAMATVNEDGSPHNSPYVFLRSPDFSTLYWGSHPESQHSRNILRSGRLFVALFEADKPGGLYIEAAEGHIAEGEELDEALAVHNAVRQSRGKAPLERAYYSGDSPQRMWAATVTGLWINGAERDSAGLLIIDYRLTVSAEELLGRL